MKKIEDLDSINDSSYSDPITDAISVWKEDTGNAHQIQDIVSLAEKLLTIKTTIDNPDGFNQALAIIKAELHGFTIESFEKNGIPSLLIHNKPEGTRQFKIVLNAHLDVVPGSEEQYVPFTKDGKLFGRGAIDMKAATAVFIQLFRKVASSVPYPLALQITTDEENGGFNGVKHQIDKGLRTDFAITGECGSNFRIVHQAKGMLRLKIIAKGKSSHSAYPWLGENAIIKLHNTIQAIMEKYPNPKEEAHLTTINVTHIQTTNTTTHTVTPENCEAILDIRFIPGDDKKVLDTIRNLLPEGVTHEVIFCTLAHQTDANNKFIQLLSACVKNSLHESPVLAKAHGASDIRHFNEVGCEGVEFGPLGGSQHHDGEWVDIDSLEKYYEIVEAFLLKVSLVENDAPHVSNKKDTIQDASAEQKVISLAKELIAIPSVYTKTTQLERIIEFTKQQLDGSTYSNLALSDYPSIIYSNRINEFNKFKVLMHAHLDVSAGENHEFQPIIKDGRLYGKGAFDTKAAAAAMITVFKEVGSTLQYPLGLHFSTNGSFNFQFKTTETYLASDLVITSEGSNFDLVYKTKGKLLINLHIQNEKNSLALMHEIISKLSHKYLIPKEATHDTTLNILKTESTESGDYSMDLDIRYYDDDVKTILSEIQRITPKNAKIEVIIDIPPNKTNPSNELIKLLAATATEISQKKIELTETYGASEANIFNKFGSDAIEFGPVGHTRGHVNVKDEWVDVKTVEQYYQILKKFLLSIN